MNRLHVLKIVKSFSIAAAFALCAVLSSAQAKLDENINLSLDKGWEFRQVIAEEQDNGGWLPATVPGDVLEIGERPAVSRLKNRKGPASR